MSARDKIAKLMWPAMLYASKVDGAGPAWVDGGNSLAQVEARQAADAILAALPDMIAPLVWEGFISGPYKIEVYDGGIATLWFYGKAIEDDDEHESLGGGYLTLVSMDDLIEAANAHHRAAIMAAFNGEAKP
jgi:hypothetical protein